MSYMAEKKEKHYVIENAQLMAEWNWERNIDITPSQVTLGSHKKARWKCSKGHEWLALVYHRKKGSDVQFVPKKNVRKDLIFQLKETFV